MIVTPRGMTIYLPRDYAFALIARLFPRVDAFTFLETTQAIYRIHGAAGYVTGLVCFCMKLSAVHIAAWTLGVTLVFYGLKFYGQFVFPGMIAVSRMYSRLTGLFVLTPLIVVIGLWRVGWLATAAYVAASLAAEGITMMIEKRAGKRIGIELGIDPTLADAGAMYLAPIRDFKYTYSLYAGKFGVSQSEEVSEEELRPTNWSPVWEDLVREWPQVASRYLREEDPVSEKNTGGV